MGSSKMIKLKQLLKENKIAKYSSDLGDYIKLLKPKINGWKFGMEHMTGSWYWEHPKFEDIIYATWGWDGQKNKIPYQSSDGLDLGTGKLALIPKELNIENEKFVKKDVKKYLDYMKKEFPKIEKKLLEY